MEQLVRLKSNSKYWQAWWIDPDGIRKTKSLGSKKFLTKREAMSVCVEMSVRTINHDSRKPKPLLVTWCDEYMELRCAELSPASVTIYKRTCKLLVDYFAEVRPDIAKYLDAVTRDDAGKWRHHITEGKSDATVCKYVRCAKVIFGLAVDHGHIEVNPFDRLRGTPRPVEREHLNLTEEQMTVVWLGFEDWLIGDWQYKSVWVALCWYAGLRKMEAYNLLWSDIDWDRDRLIVRNDGVVTSKARRREVRMEPELKKMLLDILKPSFLAAPRVIRLNKHTKINEWLQMRCQYLAGVHREHNDDANPDYIHEGVTLQQLRRCRDTIWHQQFPAYVCSAWLGHSEQVAMRHYLTIPDELYSSDPNKSVDTNITCQHKENHQ